MNYCNCTEFDPVILQFSTTKSADIPHLKIGIIFSYLTVFTINNTGTILSGYAVIVRKTRPVCFATIVSKDQIMLAMTSTSITLKWVAAGKSSEQNRTGV